MNRVLLDFLLFDWLQAGALTQRERHVDHSLETFGSVLDLSERSADKFAPVNRLVDIEEPEFDDGAVRLPAATREATAAYRASGLLVAGQDADVGGMQLPYVLEMATNAFFHEASIGLSAYGMLSCANANLVMACGTAVQRAAFAQSIWDGRAMGTMCLSEPQAGSGLADITTRAVPDGDSHADDPLGPRYRLRGNKMWISGGEHDLSDNIVHLVLAKIPGTDGRTPAGVKGISLFIVPKQLVDPQGRLTGERNDVSLAGLNHKMGYRGTVNTLLNFGEGRHLVRGGAGAIGYLVGAPGEGLQHMFHMMNEARINVGLGAAMLGIAGYAASVDYARTRVQGRPLDAGKSVADGAVPIATHPDVKRMLLAQKAYAEGALALCLYAARLIDDIRTGQPDEAEDARLLLDLLTPVVKSWPSEWCLEANHLAIQVHGGYGYTRDFPVEQYWRDNRLNLIHEGTHGIQALDLLRRKVRAEDGRALELWRQRVKSTCTRADAHTATAGYAQALRGVLDHLVNATHAAWNGSDKASEVLGNATAYLQAFGHVVMGWLMLDLAILANERVSQQEGDLSLHQGQLHATRYFFRFELPKCAVWLRGVETRDTTFLELADKWL